MTKEIAVLGAGMVGVCCAVALQERGFAVTLIDRRGPGEETSYGNAGVVTRSSLIPFNNPSLLKALPKLLGNAQNGLRYNTKFLLANKTWLAQFLANARSAQFRQTLTFLDSLIRESQLEHKRLTALSKAAHLWRDTGWLVAYRNAEAFLQAAWARAIYTEFGIAHQCLGPEELKHLEPALAPVFTNAVWVQDAQSVSDPSALVKLYAQLFVELGGRVVQAEVTHLSPSGEAWHVGGYSAHAFDHVVVALGPWSTHLLAPLGWRTPMAFERGYHQHFAFAVNGDGVSLQRPLYDTAGAYVLSPMRQGLRLTTGVELTDRDAPDNLTQLERCEIAARQALAFGAPLDEHVWRGSRPTMPDSRPVIGAVPRHKGLWCAFGHQHIGFSTGAGTGQRLSQLIAAQIVGG